MSHKTFNTQQTKEYLNAGILDKITIYINDTEVTIKQFHELRGWFLKQNLILQEVGYIFTNWEVGSRHYRKRRGVLVELKYIGDFDDFLKTSKNLIYELDLIGFGKIRMTIGLEVLDRIPIT